ncbi:MAG: hypothetical protein ABSD08_06575 [Xanthobacteraceae bacterium]|jgi:hypothetical protein
MQSDLDSVYRSMAARLRLRRQGLVGRRLQLPHRAVGRPPPAELLRASSEALLAPRLLPESGQLTAIGCGARTIGPAPEARVASLFAERRAARAVALGELGNR